METKVLLAGLIGFMAGGLLVSIAATTFDKPAATSMNPMTESLKPLSGDDFDKMFINSMTKHHQDAIDMAALADSRAKHTEIKELSQNILTMQQKEITDMRMWQAKWGYPGNASHNMENM